MTKKSAAMLAGLILGSLAAISFAQEQESLSNAPLLTFADLQKEGLESPFRIEGVVVQIQKCPPCPPGALCKPCLGDYVVATENPDVKDDHLLRIFTADPSQFELKKKYLFTVKVKGGITKGKGIDQVNLVRFVNLAIPAAPASQITATNWRQHPQIKAVRSLVEAINTGSAKGLFKSTEKRFAYCEPYEDTLRKITVDGQGVTRRYETQGGSDDSSLTAENYYDESGRLRFVFISGGAVNGSLLEHRIYFDEAGKRIWEEHKYLKGPGYTFPEVWPDEQIQKSEPAKAFAAASPCPADKSKPRKRTE